jgi:hypothetical protein
LSMYLFFEFIEAKLSIIVGIMSMKPKSNLLLQS